MTDTVRQSNARAQATREERLLALLDRFRGLPWPQGRSGEELEAVLYDEHGLPR